MEEWFLVFFKLKTHCKSESNSIGLFNIQGKLSANPSHLSPNNAQILIYSWFFYSNGAINLFSIHLSLDTNSTSPLIRSVSLNSRI